jgi:hypothetical protein
MLKDFFSSLFFQSMKGWPKSWSTDTPLVSKKVSELLSNPKTSKQLAEAIRKHRRK